MINMLLSTRRNFLKKHLPNKPSLYVYLVEYSSMGATLGNKKKKVAIYSKKITKTDRSIFFLWPFG